MRSHADAITRPGRRGGRAGSTGLSIALGAALVIVLALVAGVTQVVRAPGLRATHATISSGQKQATAEAATGQSIARDARVARPHARPVPLPHGFPPLMPLFGDGFESGTFAAWTSERQAVTGAARVQGDVAWTGARAARLSSAARPGSYVYVRKRLPAPLRALTVSADVWVAVEGAPGSNVPLLRLLDPAGRRLVSLNRQNHDYDHLWIQYGGTYHRTLATLRRDEWGHVMVRIDVSRSGKGLVQGWLNGRLIFGTVKAQLGTAGLQILQIGDDAPRQTFTLYVDNVAVRIPVKKGH